ncbi:putative membrane protein [Acinetobacter sp. 25977_4]|uniref:hypothetical protein n=1 Tax=unclassified Acinetobacter calcoaceticus/baumannii complex TaxID=2881046 RepID=UPI000449B626|nr:MULTISPECIES: hypothetical protein [unclassified Acinetobacter calcoaceticus/baumannii complex]EXT38618.1 putative membrane protein [Acinetobacter sp. 25977_8]EXT49764.1 putative membrane protein [Acinetobacter sp. 25977_4]EXT55932.1 putative membrane protein [Acinetobacter sp. 25977_3]EXT61192.1 putative membrane protein [Acinetobacter sp. 25977_2]
MKAKIQSPIQPDWWSKTFAGGGLGLSLSIAIGNLVVLLGRPYVAMDLLVQLGMWSVPWVWMPIMFASYFFTTGQKALIYLSIAIALAYSCIFVLRG